MRYAHKSPEEVPNMLWEARDKRVGEARKVGNAKTDKEKVGRRWQHVETVVGADIAEVVDLLQESVRESLSVSGKRKRRDVEDAERRVDPGARSMCPPVDLDGSNFYPGRRSEFNYQYMTFECQPILPVRLGGRRQQTLVSGVSRVR
jgi:hypothetical protein